MAAAHMTRRFPRIHREALTAEQAEVYEHIAGGERAKGPRLFELTDAEGHLNGPFEPMLLAPQLGDALQALGAAVRYRTTLSDRIREMAILAVATWWDSDFERYAHEAVGRAAGLTDEEVSYLREAGGGRPTDPMETTALDVVWTLLRERDLSDEAFAKATENLTEAQLFELTTLVGYYATLALVMRVFRADGRPAPPSDAEM